MNKREIEKELEIQKMKVDRLEKLVDEIIKCHTETKEDSMSETIVIKRPMTYQEVSSRLIVANFNNSPIPRQGTNIYKDGRWL